MNNLLMGVDLSQLEHEKPGGRIEREIVPGRTVHIDADFMAYMVSYDDEKPLVEMRHNADEMIESIRKAAGAEFVTLHLTPSGSNKGGRGEIAMTKEYQGNRKDKVKPRFLPHMRAWLHEERGAIMHFELEADDGMAIAQYNSIAKGERHLSVIATKDKDLNMVPGLLMDWDTGELSDTEDDYGYIKIKTMDNKAKTKKIVGRGHAFFWAQMLMGDSADNVAGLPLVHCPKFIKGKPKSCGPVMAYDILGKCKSNKEAFDIVRNLYMLHGQKTGFKNYRNGEKIKGSEAFVSEAQLLWMRRKDSINDVIDWLGEING